MNVQTSCGIDIYCLPDNAKCCLTGKDPLDMTQCPALLYDPYGERCVPEECVYYKEED